MRTRQTMALGVAFALATGLTLQPLGAGSQGSGSISGVAKDAKKPYQEFSVRGRVLDGPGAGNLTQPIPLDDQAKFNLAGIDLAKYQVELLNKNGKVVCTEGPFDLTQQANRPNVVIDCHRPVAWMVLGAAAAAGITAGLVAGDDDAVAINPLVASPSR